MKDVSISLDQGGRQLWEGDECDAGYQARVHDSSDYLTATSCWRAGWQDADQDLKRVHSAEYAFVNSGAAVPWWDFGTAGRPE